MPVSRPFFKAIVPKTGVFVLKGQGFNNEHTKSFEEDIKKNCS
ncbi:hypothetical protein B4135_2674 [Caldibacillus debilis]|uniref:Uncharacterized protein n=1 Tax=Caldibacillus debilis TaxID=301148 RepID=A0A150LUS3_9BACI|nr:hypothetical protein B4135_2674 [Caldibacillus debilis]